MKRHILCFDGTWNTPDDDAILEEQRVETNARRFYRSVSSIGADGLVQEPWYNEGVGTYVLNKLTGGAFGAGLDKHILDGYRYLVDNYHEGDQVFILGFSRGAYTARSLVGMIRNCGLVRPSAASFQVGMAYGLYRTREEGPDSFAARSFRSLFAREIPIRFLGVWDTVGALGIPLEAANRLNHQFYEFHDTKLSKIVERAYQAGAIDEHRQDYDITLWNPTEKPGQTLEQRWFAGAHSDIGGGYPDRRLSDLTLRWMQDRAMDAGLALTPVPVGVANYKGPLTDSYQNFLKGLYRTIHPRHYRSLLSTRFGNEVLDPSVELRRRDSAIAYRPINTGIPQLIS
ncbi:DUF2235 domain-containing protein [Singulisphaera acidiphila]|uniref:T6SS Phospholipase effector Tle1-like catalytic domain-containing protein n=1 Tax=Singulisphaera acidiphila (strain ATCC BAA-1392 / DSM 18658 / VKM B-2454 / MOB10) TaxID=886293 RepID=L0DF71_SINAD|nr:DUF2235 domain-containing protein [Singulisphaera acidiphila]AGA27892.1 hypothetical protein Sinac_3644 [Singulisphaera acidiphila DSM 18658]